MARHEELLKLNQEQAMMAGASPRQMTPRERLEQKKRHLEAELTNVNAALDALTAHPDIEKVFELVGLALQGPLVDGLFAGVV